jgi:RHS repeat-associated protein
MNVHFFVLLLILAKTTIASFHFSNNDHGKSAAYRFIDHHTYSVFQSHERAYTWDPNDRIKSIVDSQFGARDFGYDSLGNLAWASKGQDFSFRAPDAVGNLFRTGEQGDRKYGPGGQLLEARTKEGTAKYSYDAEGNLIRKVTRKSGSLEDKVWEYHWNALGMLTRVLRPDGREVSFEYDPLGRRLRKKIDNKTTHWIWDGNVPLHEWVSERGKPNKPVVAVQSQPVAVVSDRLLSGLLNTQPSQGPPEPDSVENGTASSPITWLFDPESFAPMAKLVGERKYSILTDHLGTPYVMADDDDKQVWSADVDTYGARQGGTGHAQLCPFRFPGQYEDEETGLYYNRFRYYDPEAGGYVSQDPIGLHGGARSYAYVGNPLNWSDPVGLSGCKDVSTSKNTAFFWSGRTDGVGGQDIAREIAESRGGTTLEKLLEERKIKMPEWDKSNPVSVKAWEDISAAYAENVSGDVRAVVGKELRPGNIWEGKELNALMNNPNVTSITKIDPKTLEETEIFRR